MRMEQGVQGGYLAEAHVQMREEVVQGPLVRHRPRHPLLHLRPGPQAAKCKVERVRATPSRKAGLRDRGGDLPL